MDISGVTVHIGERKSIKTGGANMPCKKDFFFKYLAGKEDHVRHGVSPALSRKTPLYQG